MTDKLKNEVVRRYVSDIERALKYVINDLEVTEENIEYVTNVINNMLIGYGTIKSEVKS